MIVGTNLVFALIQQWIVPGIENSLIPFSVSTLRTLIQEFMTLVNKIGSEQSMGGTFLLDEQSSELYY